MNGPLEIFSGPEHDSASDAERYGIEAMRTQNPGLYANMGFQKSSAPRGTGAPRHTHGAKKSRAASGRLAILRRYGYRSLGMDEYRHPSGARVAFDEGDAWRHGLPPSRKETQTRERRADEYHELETGDTLAELERYLAKYHKSVEGLGDPLLKARVRDRFQGVPHLSLPREHGELSRRGWVFRGASQDISAHRAGAPPRRTPRSRSYHYAHPEHGRLNLRYYRERYASSWEHTGGVAYATSSSTGKRLSAYLAELHGQRGTR
jgi:hypothetical protein